MAKKSDDIFRLFVNKKVEKRFKNLLKTEITLPQRNKGIFGFEDADGSLYFISFHRQLDAGVIDWASGEVSGRTPGLGDADPIRVSTHFIPSLVKYIKPVYPKNALEKEKGTDKKKSTGENTLEILF
jgi:hypothetical protein